MASTVDQVITKFKRVFPQCGATRANQIFTDIHREIIVRLRLRENTVTVNLTQGTQEYDFDAANLRVFAAEYIASSADGDYVRLKETSIDHEDILDPLWRSRVTQDSPTKYYLRNVPSADSSKQVVGFLPIPETTTATGYPIVRLYCQVEGLISGSETVPPQLLSDQIYVCGMGRDYSTENDPKQVPLWDGLYEAEMQRNIVHVKDRLDRL